MAAIFGSLHNGSLPWIHDRSIFVGNATDIACGPDAPHSGPGLLLMHGTGGGCLLSFLMWVLSGLGETASGTKPMETNHVGAFILIPPFYLALGAIIGWRVVDCTLGCSAWASSAPSISFFTANIQREGYMMLFMTLMLTALIFFKRIDKMARRRYVDAAKGVAHPWSRSSLVGEWMMRCGFVLTTITGIMPSLASNCHLQPASRYERCWEEEMSNPHGVGVAAGIFLTFCGYQLRAVGPIAMHSGVEGASAYAYYTLFVSELAFLCMPASLDAPAHAPRPLASLQRALETDTRSHTLFISHRSWLPPRAKVKGHALTSPLALATQARLLRLLAPLSLRRRPKPADSRRLPAAHDADRLHGRGPAAAAAAVGRRAAGRVAVPLGPQHRLLPLPVHAPRLRRRRPARGQQVLGHLRVPGLPLLVRRVRGDD